MVDFLKQHWWVMLGGLALGLLLGSGIIYSFEAYQRRQAQQQTARYNAGRSQRAAAELTSQRQSDSAYNRLGGRAQAAHPSLDSLRHLDENLTRRLRLLHPIPAGR